MVDSRRQAVGHGTAHRNVEIKVDVDLVIAEGATLTLDNGGSLDSLADVD